jgi:hypothetical protein
MIDVDKMSEAELDAYLLNNSLASTQGIDVNSLNEEQLDRLLEGKELSPAERNEFIGMGSSVAGALGGAALGTAILPGIGTVIGGIAGGALGAFGGELAEDYASEEDLNYANAAKEAAISIGIDVATLGTMKFAKPVYFAGKRALGFTAEEVAKDIAEKATATVATQKAGTPLSLASSQSLLQEKGATLTPIQLGDEGVLSFYDRLSRSGLLSSADFEQNMVKANEAISGAIVDLMGKNEAGVLMKGELGNSVNSLLYEGKKAIGKQYDTGLKEIAKSIKNDKVNVIPIHKAIDNFVKGHANPLGGSNLDEATLKLLSGLKSDLTSGIKKEVVFEDVPSSLARFGRQYQKAVGKKTVPEPVPALDVLEWHKKVNSKITELSNPNSPMYAGVKDSELAKVSKLLRNVMDKSMRGVNPEAYSKYLDIKSAYREGITTLKPDAIKSIINTASKGDYENLGKMFFQEGVVNINKFDETWKAVNYAVKTIEPEQLSSLGFKNKGELFDTIKSSYVLNMFPKVDEVAFDLTTYAGKMGKLTREEILQAKKVLGKDYGRFNQIRNAILDASNVPGNDVGLLALRSKELQAGTAVAAGSVGGFGVGLFALFTPKVMAKISLNPKTSAMLINALNRTSKTPEGLSQTERLLRNILIAEGIDLATGELVEQ